jgi:predicted SPOUT superfamily RNA methylase MTH1
MFREGVVIDVNKNDSSSDKVDVGLNHHISINRTLTPNVRVTVQILSDKKAKVVSPSTPRTDYGTYWGYNTRIATTLANVFNECPYEKYDLKVGLSDKGLKVFENNNEDAKFSLPQFKHILLCFGIGKDLDTVIANDETMTSNIFDIKLDVFPKGGTRTIRTEEALIIALSRLQPLYKNINK